MTKTPITPPTTAPAIVVPRLGVVLSEAGVVVSPLLAVVVIPVGSGGILRPVVLVDNEVSIWPLPPLTEFRAEPLVETGLASQDAHGAVLRTTATDAAAGGLLGGMAVV